MQWICRNNLDIMEKDAVENTPINSCSTRDVPLDTQLNYPLFPK